MNILSSVIFLILIFSNLLFSQSTTWVKIHSDPSFDVESIDDSLLFISTYNNGLIFSSDNGNSWIQKNPSPTSTPLTKLCVNNLTKSIFAFSLGDHKIYRSSNFGDVWNSSLSINAGIVDIISKTGIIYAISDSGVFYLSTDNGISWDSSYVSKGLKCIDVCRTGPIFIGPNYMSADTGKSWTFNNMYANSIAIDNNNNILNCSDIFKVSKDCGLSWEFLIVLGSIPYIGYTSEAKVSFDNDNNWYLGGDYVLKSTNSGKNWISLGGPYSYLNRKVKIFGNNIYLATPNGLFRYDPAVQIYVGTNYFPLKQGNRWQFLYTTSNSYGDHDYYLQQDEITDDTIIQDHRYYKIKDVNGNQFFDFENRWIRYSEENKKIYIWSNDSDAVFMDFSLPAGSTFNQVSNFNSITTQTKMLEGLKFIFNDTVEYKGYQAGSGYHGYHEQWFVENIGPISFDDYNMFGPGVKYDNYSVLINAVIYDSTNALIYYSNHFKPEFSIIPVTKIDNDTLKLNFSVNHRYTKFSNSYYNKNVNFIDIVYMDSYYSNGKEIISNNTVSASNVLKTTDYFLTSVIDTCLLKNGFILNYKLIAKDRNLIPEFSSSPDTGYYQCRWDNTTSVTDGGNYLLIHKLEQNYPNPFNTTTKIKFEIPDNPSSSTLTKGGSEGSRGRFVTLKVYDVLGNEIVTLVNEEMEAGYHSVNFDASNLPSGVYFYHLKVGEFTAVKKLILLK